MRLNDTLCRHAPQHGGQRSGAPTASALPASGMTRAGPQVCTAVFCQTSLQAQTWQAQQTKQVRQWGNPCSFLACMPIYILLWAFNNWLCTSAVLLCYVTQRSEGVQVAITQPAVLVTRAVLVSTAKSVCFVTASSSGSIAKALSIWTHS